MGQVYAIIKVFPSDPSNIQQIIEKIKDISKEKSYYNFVKFEEEEIAFGAKAIRVHVIMPEELEGGTSEIEDLIRNIEGVEELEVEYVSRVVG